MSKNYETREFVMVKPSGTRLGQEGDIMLATLGASVVKRIDVINLKARLVRGRAGYRSKGGSDYAELEAGKCFASYLKQGILRELK
jgi:hypothetical protein